MPVAPARLIVYAALTALGSAAPLGAQSTAPSAVSNLRLAVACPASPCRFRQGEVIPLNLVFSADAPDYGVFITYPGRFAYLHKLDRFTAEPAEHAVDPTAASAQKFGVAGSFNPTPVNLIPGNPVNVPVELNQWLHFSKPGKYWVTAFSSRACACGELSGLRVWSPSNNVDLVSKPLEVEIVAATPDWQRRELARIVWALPDTLVSSTEAERAAVRALSYLETDEALQEIRKRLAANAGRLDIDWLFARAVLPGRSSSEAGR
jgi:hypothetical protein